MSDDSRRLPAKELDRIDAWWRAANYLSVGQIYLLDNPMLREPLPAVPSDGLPQGVDAHGITGGHRLGGHWVGPPSRMVTEPPSSMRQPNTLVPSRSLTHR